jgi:amino acid transporter
MKIAAIICNIVLFIFTCFVLITDGPAGEASYIVFTLLLLLVPIMNIVLMLRSRINNSWSTFNMRSKVPEEQGKVDAPPSIYPFMKIIGVILNIVLTGFICWAIIDQYPHPKDPGFLIYMLLVIFTPIISLITILTGRADRIRKRNELLFLP